MTSRDSEQVVALLDMAKSMESLASSMTALLYEFAKINENFAKLYGEAPDVKS